MPKLAYPTLVTWTDPSGKTHIPPDPPLNQGYPPWFPRPNEYRRDEPLARCPSLSCRRAKRCVSVLYGEFCQKTHMEREEFRWQIVKHIDEIYVANGWPIVEDVPGTPVPTPPPSMKRLLEERQAELIREELLKFQQGWIEKQKAAYAKKHRPSINSPQDSPGITKP